MGGHPSATLTATQISERPATIEAAQLLCQQLNATAHHAGYMVALYGSVLTNGRGRDIDLLAVPWRYGASEQLLLDAFRALGCIECGSRYHGAMGTASTLLRTPDGLLVDLQVREQK